MVAKVMSGPPEYSTSVLLGVSCFATMQLVSV